MGDCVSRPVRRRLISSKKCLKRRTVIRRLVSSRKPSKSINKVNKFGQDRSYSNPTFQGSTEEVWFDSFAAFESDGEDDFKSVQDEFPSPNGSNNASMSRISSPKDVNLEDFGENITYIHKSGELLTGNPPDDSINELVKNENSQVLHSDDVDSQTKPNRQVNKAKSPVSIDDTYSHSVDETDVRKEGGILDHCGILSNTCLPCLASTVSTVEKRRYLSPGTPSTITKKKAALKLSFKWREGHANSTLFSSKMLLQRPIAGSQVPFCPLEKKMLDSWSHVDSSTFKIRGENYFKDKKKDFASNNAAFYPFGVDVYLSPRKINHIARFVELPPSNSCGKLPPILVVNVQVPLYPATIFQSEIDGEGINFVFYFRLSENYSKELPLHFQENIRRLIDDEVEKVRGFALDTILPFRERLKILGRVANVEDVHMSAAERKLINAYNEKPVLSRPQHEFHLGENYLEIDLDMHRFSYISRKGFEAFQERLKFCILDFGLTIQANKAEELPEQILCCVRLNGIDYANYQQLGLSQLPF